MLRSVAGHVRRTAKKNAPPAIQKWKIVRGDTVEVNSGSFKGQRGTVLKCLRKSNQVVIEGVNVQSRLLKVGAEEKASLKKFESPIHYSNVSLVDPALGVPTKVSFGFNMEIEKKQDQKVRLSKKKQDGKQLIIPKPEVLKQKRSPRGAGNYNDTSSDVVLQTTYSEDVSTSDSVNDVLQDAMNNRRGN